MSVTPASGRFRAADVRDSSEWQSSLLLAAYLVGARPVAAPASASAAGIRVHAVEVRATGD
jgi:hypothetical protein